MFAFSCYHAHNHIRFVIRRSLVRAFFVAQAVRDAA